MMSAVSHCAGLKLESVNTLSETKVLASGRITSATSATLHRTICELIPAFNRIILDLSRVDYIDNSGLGVLVGLYNHAKGTKCYLEIANFKPGLRDLVANWLESVPRLVKISWR